MVEEEIGLKVLCFELVTFYLLCCLTESKRDKLLLKVFKFEADLLLLFTDFESLRMCLVLLPAGEYKAQLPVSPKILI